MAVGTTYSHPKAPRSAAMLGSAAVESPGDADVTCALVRSATLRWEPGDAMASGDEDSDAAGDVSTSAGWR